MEVRRHGVASKVLLLELAQVRRYGAGEQVSDVQPWPQLLPSCPSLKRPHADASLYFACTCSHALRFAMVFDGSLLVQQGLRPVLVVA